MLSFCTSLDPPKQTISQVFLQHKLQKTDGQVWKDLFMQDQKAIELNCITYNHIFIYKRRSITAV
jgi:hypothetical protein